MKAVQSRLGLEGKFVLLAAVVFILGSSIANRLVFSYERDVRLSTVEEKGTLLTEAMAISFTHTLLFEAIGLVEESGLLDSFIRGILEKQELDVRRVMVFDPQRRIIAHDDYQEYGKTYKDDYTRRALSSQKTLIQRYSLEGGNVLDIATPLQISYKRWGTLRLIVSLHKEEAELQSYAYRLAFLTVVSAVVSIAIALVVARGLARPIKHLASAMQEIGTDFHTDFKADRSDEIGLLQHDFLEMVNRLRTAVQEQARLQRMLLHADRLTALGTMAAGVAHEINNPLTGMRSCLERIEKKPDNLTQTRSYTGFMLKALDRIEKVVQGMLDFSRQEKKELAFQPIQLTEILQEVVDLVEHRLHGNQIELITGFETDFPEIQGDRLGIGQVFLNLTLNAIDAMPDGGQLHLSCERTGEHLVTVVRDTGQGIPESLIDRIFEPFYTTKEVGRGVGLGLSIVHGIVDKHGGRIDVDSEEGKGAVFTVYFPLSRKAGESDETDA